MTNYRFRQIARSLGIGALCVQLSSYGLPSFAQQLIQSTVQPKELWGGTYYGYFNGYESMGALISAINAAQDAAFNRCIAFESAYPPYSCNKMVITGASPEQPLPSTTPQKINGVESNWYTQGYNYYLQVDYPQWTTYTGTSTAVPILLKHTVDCPVTDGLNYVSTSLGNNSYKVECIKYEPAPEACTPDARGKTAGSGAAEAVGNPISVIGGRKTEAHLDYASADGMLRIDRRFQGQYQGWAFPGEPELVDPSAGTGRGVRELRQYTDVDAASGTQFTYTKLINFPFVSSSSSAEVQRLSRDGSTKPYRADASGNFPVGSDGEQLQRINPPTAQGATWRWKRGSNVTDEYGPEGRPRRKYWPDGKFVVFAYSGENLASITDHFGRQLAATYDANGRLSQFLLPDGSAIAYDYAGELLTRVTYADGSFRTFSYGEPAYSANATLRAPLTGRFDELGVRVGTYKYDSSGRAFSTEGANGVEKFSLNQMAAFVEVTPPVGDPYRVYFTDVAGARVVQTRNQPAGSGCTASSSSLAYDTSGNVTSKIDFTGRRACYGYDLSRNIETVRVEGTGTAVCTGLTAPGVSLPAGSRKVNTQWHPDWRRETKVAEPGRMTTYVYNGQPDPFNGNALASCAPAGALLPDGKPIAVLCRQVEQATTDANGSLGFGATLDSTVANREQKWTYNQYGQILTYDGPRTDVVDVTTYAYYTDTSFTGTGSAAVGHTTGDLQSVTNAAGQVTQYTKYDKHGQLLESTDPNGVVTANTYDLRQRLLSSSVGGQTTTYTYDAAGLLKRVTRPDGSWLGYDYDPAHRQIAVYDNLGNRIDYTLDNAGNRTGEAVKDTGGALKRQLARSIDALGRVQQITGRN